MPASRQALPVFCSSVPIRKRGTKKTVVTRPAHQEDKLDQLVSLNYLQAPLQETRQNQSLQLSQFTFPDPDNLPPTQSSASNSSSSLNVEQHRSTSTNQSSSSSLFVDDISAFVTPEKTAQEQLMIFRSCFRSVFPFLFLTLAFWGTSNAGFV
jgi:hypothetical protein